GDIMAILLGCDSLMLLQPLDTDKYIVVSEAFYNRAIYRESISSPFPKGYRPVWQYNEKSRSYLISFLHCDSRELQVDDPRSEGIPLPSGRRKKDQGLEETGNRVVNNDTEEDVGSYDPRLNIEFFKSRGVNMETLTLV
ncbi:hypothetical protein BKA64DRAFT_580343, partial [Cadophora sp. MPI-SDFR-AT-0126]